MLLLMTVDVYVSRCPTLAVSDDFLILLKDLRSAMPAACNDDPTGDVKVVAAGFTA